MRIVGGALKGRKIEAPATDGGAARLRPTSDRMRESLFNILEHGDYTPLDGARVLDIFAGTGALGLEALSRGAGRATFIDDGAEARALIRTNIDALGVIGQTKLFRRDGTKLGENRDGPYDLIFLDAPYNKGMTLPALQAAHKGGWIAEGATLVVETAADEALETPGFLDLADQRTYGAGQIRIFSAKG